MAVELDTWLQNECAEHGCVIPRFQTAQNSKNLDDGQFGFGMKVRNRIEIAELIILRKEDKRSRGGGRGSLRGGL